MAHPPNIWEYEDRRASFRSRSFRTGASRNTFRRLAGEELQRRGVDPGAVQALAGPTAESRAAHQGRLFPDPALSGTSTGKRQLQMLKDIQQLIREGKGPEEAVRLAQERYVQPPAQAEEEGGGGGILGTLGRVAETAIGEVAAAPVRAVEFGARQVGIRPEGATDPDRPRPSGIVREGAAPAVGRFAERFLDPSSALGLQIVESPVGGAIPFVTELKATQRGLEEVGVSEDVSPLPRTRTFEEAFEGGAVNPITAAFGNDTEIEHAQLILEEAGLPRALAAQLIFDPLNLLPGVGFTHFKDLGRLLRAASRVSGASRRATIAAVRGNRVVTEAMSGARRLAAEEVGGGVRRELRPFIRMAKDEGLVDPQAIMRRAQEIAEAQGAQPIRFRRLTGRGAEQARRLTEPAAVPGTEPFTPSPKSERIRAQVAADGGEPPKLPPGPDAPTPPGGGPPLVPGGTVPSVAWWRVLENKFTFGDLPRQLVEAMSTIPALRPLIRVLTSPAALAGTDPAIRAAVTYQGLHVIQANELGVRLARTNRTWDDLVQRRVVRESGSPGQVRYSGLRSKDVAFGDLAQDIIANGNKFKRVPAALREWVLDQKKLIDELAAQYEDVTGEVLRLENDYWPRFGLNDEGNVIISSRIGAKQSPVKRRMFDIQADAIAQGVPYAGPLETPRLYGLAIQKMIRDKLLFKIAVEDKIVTTVSARLNKSITSLRTKINKMTKEGLDIKDVGEFQRLNKRLEQRVRARERIRTPVKRKGEVLFGDLGPAFASAKGQKAVLKTLKDIIGPGVVGGPGKGLRAATHASGVIRLLKTGLADVGHFFLQMITLLESPQKWGHAVGVALRSMADPQYYREFLERYPGVGDAVAHGVTVSKTEFTEVTERFAALRRIPGARQIANVLGTFPRGFEAGIGSSKIFKYEGLAHMSRVAGEGETELFRIGSYVNTKLGTTESLGLGLSATQRQIESAFVLYSPRYTRSIFGMIGWAFSKGIPARDAQRSIASLLAGGAATFYAVGTALGLSHDDLIDRLTPTNRGKFMSLPIGGNEYGVGTAYRSTLGFLGSLLREDNWDFDTWEEAALDNPLVRYLRSRSAPTTGTLMDFIEGEDFIGDKVSIEDFIDDPARLLDYAQNQFLPLNVEALFEARGTFWQKALAGGVETAGGRTFPRSAFVVFEEAQESEFQRLRALGEVPYTKYDSYEQLRAEDTPAADAIDNSAPVEGAKQRLEEGRRFRKPSRIELGFDKIDATREEQTAAQLLDDDRLNSHLVDAETWQDNLHDRQQIYFARREEIIENFELEFKDRESPPYSVNAAIEDFFAVNVDVYTDTQTGLIDWAGFFAARSQALAGLTSKQRSRVETYINKYDTPTVREFEKAQDSLRPFWDLSASLWNGIRERDPQFSSYETFDSYLLDKANELRTLGVQEELIGTRLSRFPFITSINSAISDLRERYRRAHSDVDALLVKWYGMVPIRLQGTSSSRPFREVSPTRGSFRE